MSLRHLSLALLLWTLAISWGPAHAAGLLSGSAEMNWAQYQLEREGSDEFKASHFVQTYSLMYQSRHLINYGRAGEWNVGVGYVWSSLNSSIDGDDTSLSDGKIIYEGNFTFAPGGLPLRIHGYSYDLTAPGPSSAIRYGDLVNSNIAVDIQGGGKQMVTGLTLLAGITNGSYLGEYRELLSKFPKLLIDYRETYIDDSSGLDPAHTRLRDLAFISLNKKDNWFHYRVTEYTDYNDDANNFEEREYIIGTIDHAKRRAWINLTNWIRLSADGYLNQYQATRTQLGRLGPATREDTYGLNLFTSMRRGETSVNNFTSLTRYTDGEGYVEKGFSFPTYASGRIDPYNFWRLGAVMNFEEEVEGGDASREENDFHSNFRLDSDLGGGKQLTSYAVAERSVGNEIDDTRAVRLEFELRSDTRLVSAFPWLASYALGWFSNEESGDDYLEQKVTIAGDYSHSPGIRFGGSQSLAVGGGAYSGGSGTYGAWTATGFGETDTTSSSEIDGTSYRSLSEIYLELTPGPSLSQRLTATYDLIVRPEEDLDRLKLSHNLKYQYRTLVVDSLTVVEVGDGIESPAGSEHLGGLNRLTGKPDFVAGHRTRFDYAPNPKWQSTGYVNVDWADGELGSGWLFSARQEARYNLFRATGTRSKWLQLEQYAHYEKMKSGDLFGFPGNPWYAAFGLAATCYPMRFVTLGARSELRHFGLSGQTELEYGLDAVVEFPQLVANISYEYGERDEGDNFGPWHKEQRWEVGIKKTF